jgi:hypothetical protein
MMFWREQHADNKKESGLMERAVRTTSEEAIADTIIRIPCSLMGFEIPSGKHLSQGGAGFGVRASHPAQEIINFDNEVVGLASFGIRYPTSLGSSTFFGEGYAPTNWRSQVPLPGVSKGPETHGALLR